MTKRTLFDGVARVQNEVLLKQPCVFQTAPRYLIPAMKLCVECNSHYDDVSEACPADGGNLLDVGTDPLIGQIVGGRYRILHVLGKGSMGIVYKGIQSSSGREMAIKFLLKNSGSTEPKESMIKRFQREAKTLSTLKHPNIVTLFDFGFTDDNQPYLVTEFLHGLTLTQLLRQNGCLPPNKAGAVFRQVCEAVAEAHKHKVVHRDIKPDNIFLQGRDQGGRFIKVLDFGIAKLLDSRATSSLTMDGRVCGSPAYMSPEQCKGLNVDYRCDIYSLAAVIFETLTGRRLFAGDDAMSVMFAHVNEPAPMLTSVRNDPAFTPELERVLQRALSKEPSRRQQSVEEFWESFAAAAQGKPVTATGAVDWIPFSSAGGKDLSDRAEREPIAIDWDQVVNAGRDKPFMYVHEFKRKRRLLIARLILLVCCAILIYMLYDSNHDKVTVEAAETMINHGRPEDAVHLLEGVRNKHPLSADDNDRLNNAYLQSAFKFAKKKQYNEALGMLQHIPSRSRYSSQANELTRRIKRLRSV